MAREHKKIKGTMLLLAASGCFCLAGILVRCASDIEPLKLAFFRAVLVIGSCCVVVGRREPAQCREDVK